MDINVTITDGVRVVRVSGGMSADAIAHRRGEIEAMAAGDGQKLVIDLGAVEFIDSAGIGAIVYLVKRCRRAGGAVKIANVNGMVKDVFRMAGLDQALDLYSSIDDALKSYPQASRRRLVSRSEYASE